MFIKVLSVTQITEYIKKLFNSDVILSSVSVRGEISNFKHHYTGHMYFTLKDDTCRIKCVMFKSSCERLKFYPQDGMNVVVKGRISVYDRDGQYQIYVDDMQQEGIGALYAAYEQLKKRLETEGLFDKSHKIPIPPYPKKVGVITSSTGAAVRDIINIITRRCPGVDILLVPVLVQGSEAAGEIAGAIRYLNTRSDIDVIITGRGGGSIEELWAFNEEIVALAIYESRIPVISAVGHETDFTIADFVSDLREPTPSAAAELCVPDKRELYYRLNSCLNSLMGIVSSNLDESKYKLKHLEKSLYSMNPAYEINQKRQYIDSLVSTMESSMNHKVELCREKLKKFSSTLDSLSPIRVLARGYSIAMDMDGNIIDDTDRVKKGDNIDVIINNGMINCNVQKIEEGGYKIGGQ